MNELKDVLSEFADEVKPVDLQQRVLATSRRIGVRRNVTLAAAALCVIAVAATTVLNTSAQGDPMPLASQPVTPAPSLPDPIMLPEMIDDDFHPVKADLIQGQHVVIPGCGNNKLQLDDSDINSRIVVDDVWESDVDHDGKKDLIVSLGCGLANFSVYPVNQVVVFKRAKGELQPIGQVVGTQNGVRIRKITVSDNGKINVLVYKGLGAPPYSPFQWRIYAWQNSKIRQVDGPTSFPVNAGPAASLGVDSAVVTLSEVDAGRYIGNLAVTVFNSGEADVQNTRISMVVPNQIKPTGKGWENCRRSAPSQLSDIECTLGPLAAGARRELRFEVVAIGRAEGGNGNLSVRIVQTPPLVLESSTPLWAIMEFKYQ